MSEITKATCLECSRNFTNNFDKYSLQATGRCVDCQKKWENRPENDPDLKAFDVSWSRVESGQHRIYAKDIDEAREKYLEEVAEGDEDIDDINEVIRK